MITEDFKKRLSDAVEFRKDFLAEPHETAFRLVNGFTEHLPGLVIDIFAKTAVIQDFSEDGAIAADSAAIKDLLLEKLNWIKAVLLKKRSSEDASERGGALIHGAKPDTVIREAGVRYAVDLMLNRDCSFYPDTRLLRKWLLENSSGKSVLNMFAYTGSLGAAAYAGHAAGVLQTDLSEKFLAVAMRTYTLNKFYFNRKSFIAGDFFQVAGKLKKEERRFDCVILDPPFFAKTDKGTIDLAKEPLVPINKVRPLAADGGVLIVVNNSLFLSGEDFLKQIDSVCDGHYLKRESILAVPPDFIGPDPDYLKSYPANPAPFNHPTKMVILRVATKKK